MIWKDLPVITLPQNHDQIIPIQIDICSQQKAKFM